ncbi:MAG: DUF3540 domain-containing protein [Gemmatimonadales bacterium]|nr:MAG: DUF3540 domain-containing protein [Gemmatimonadales bacterium]
MTPSTTVANELSAAPSAAGVAPGASVSSSGRLGDGRYTGPARVVEAAPSSAGVLRVLLPGETVARDAVVAYSASVSLTEGSRVLVTRGESVDEVWAIGILDAPERRLATRDGASAAVVCDEAGEMLEVRDAQGGLLFQYDPARGVTRVQVLEGDLELLAPMGEVTIAAGGGLHLQGRSIQLKTLSSVRILVHDLASRVLGSLGLGRGGLEVKTAAVNVETGESNLVATRSRFRAEQASLDTDRLRTRARTMEVEAESLVQRVGTLTRWVRDLAQFRAGRVRSLVKGSWISRSGRADLRSKETFKVDGDRIHLG